MLWLLALVLSTPTLEADAVQPAPLSAPIVVADTRDGLERFLREDDEAHLHQRARDLALLRQVDLSLECVPNGLRWACMRFDLLSRIDVEGSAKLVRTACAEEPHRCRGIVVQCGEGTARIDVDVPTLLERFVRAAPKRKRSETRRLVGKIIARDPQGPLEVPGRAVAPVLEEACRTPVKAQPSGADPFAEAGMESTGGDTELASIARADVGPRTTSRPLEDVTGPDGPHTARHFLHNTSIVGTARVLYAKMTFTAQSEAHVVEACLAGNRRCTNNEMVQARAAASSNLHQLGMTE